MTNSITNDWRVEKLEAYPEFEGQTNVVFNVHWRLIATDGEYVSTIYGTVPITFDPDAPFTPSVGLTKDQVIGWVHDYLGPEVVASYEDKVASLIEEQSSPPVIALPLPWAG